MLAGALEVHSWHSHVSSQPVTVLIATCNCPLPINIPWRIVVVVGKSVRDGRRNLEIRLRRGQFCTFVAESNARRTFISLGANDIAQVQT